MYVKNMIEPPVRIPGQPLGAKRMPVGRGGMKCEAKITKTMIAVIFKATITLLAFADSRMPRTSKISSSQHHDDERRPAGPKVPPRCM